MGIVCGEVRHATIKVAYLLRRGEGAVTSATRHRGGYHAYHQEKHRQDKEDKWSTGGGKYGRGS